MKGRLEVRERGEKLLAVRTDGMGSACEVHVCILLHSKRERKKGKMHTVNYYVILHYIRMQGKTLSEMLSVEAKAINLRRRRHEDIYIMHKNCFK